MAYNGVQIDNSPNIIVITDSDANQITVTQPLTRTVEVAALGPQGPVGPQGPTGSMAESNSGSFSITGSLTVSGSSTFTNIGPAIFSGSVNISGSAFYNGKEILTTAITGGFVTTSSFNAFTSSINAFTASYNTGSFTGSFIGVANLTSFSASSAVVTGNVTVLGTASINTLIVNQTQLSTGSNQLGDAADDTQTLYGTVRIPTGSLTVSGSSFFTGSLNLGTGTVIYGDTTNPSLFLDQTTGAYLKYGTTSEVTVQGSTAILKASNTVQLRTGTTTHLFVSSSGYIGIGTIVPTSKLQIATGSVLIDNNFSYRQKTSIGGNIGLIYIDNSDLMGIYEGKINVTSTGNVGIGVTSPQARLHISSSATSTPTMLIGRANGQSSIKASSDANGNYLSLDSNGSATIINHYVSDNIWLGSGGGSVAVGHNSPLARLHVKGTSATSATTSLLVQNANASSSLAILDDGNIGIGTTTPESISNTTALTINGGNGGGAVSFQVGGVRTGLVNGNDNYLTIQSYASRPLSLGYNGNNTIVVNTSNNVGIGTTNPTTKLQVNGVTQIVESGNTAFYGGNYVRVFNDQNFNIRNIGGTTVANISVSGSSYFNGGNVGVGITTPTVKLDISGSIRSEIEADGNFITLQATGQRIHFIKRAAQILQFTSDAASTYDVRFDSSNSSVYILTGSVGIGTTSPQRRLHVDTSGSAVTETQLALTSTDVNNRIGILFGSSSLASGRQHKLLHRNNSPRGEWILNASAGESGIWRFLPTDDIVYSLSITTPFNGGTASITTGVSQSLLSLSAGAATSTLNISSSDRVSIGTTSTPFKFNVQDTSATYIAQFRGSNNTYIISGDTSLAGESGLNARNSVGQLFLGIGPGGDAYFTGTSGATALNFGVGSVNAIWVNSLRNVGIGTSGSVSARLHVSGSSGSALLRVDSDVSSSILFVSGSGNVGIGTTTPIEKLHIRQDQNLATQIRVENATNDTNSRASISIGSIGDSITVARYLSNYTAVSGWANKGAVITDSNLTGGFFFRTAAGPIAFQPAGNTDRVVFAADGNVGIGTTTPAARLHIKGAGSTSTSTGLLVENASSAPAFTVTDDLNARFYGNVGVRVTPSASFHVAGNTILSGSAGTGSALTVYKSGSTVMSIQGSQGELFSITDSLSGSLFSVSNISGLPILEVFSDNTVLLGSYLDPMLMTTQRLTANSGSTVIYSLPTASYDGVFVDYVIRSGSNARAGQFMGMWSGSSTNFTDNSTTDFGDTTGFVFGLIVSGSNMVLTGSASTSAWTVRAGIRSI